MLAPDRDSPHRGDRLEDRRLLTGTGRFTADGWLPGMLHGVFVRSDHAHADLTGVDAAAALAMPGMHAVLTGADAVAAGCDTFFQMMSLTGSDGRAIATPKRPVLAHGRVRYVGEPVALVVADTENAARDAAGVVEVQMRERPAAVRPDAALAPGAALLHDEAPGNRAFVYDLGDAATVDAVFAGAHHVARLAVESTRVAPTPLEPRACLVAHDAASDVYTLHLPAQGINMMRLQLSKLTGVPAERLVIHTRDVGGSFGQRSQSYPEYAALMLAARRTGRPVRWVSTRSEGFVADTHGRGILADGRLALDADGRFLALRIDYTVDLGAYPTPGGPASHIRNPVAGATGVYRIPAVCVHIEQAFTNTVPIAAYRGAGRPDCVYAIERLVDQAAFETGIDPAELRRRNFIPRAAFPYRTPSGIEYEECDFAAVQARAMAIADHAGFAARRAAAARAGRLLGIGLASAIEVSWAGVFPKDQIRIEALPDGSIDVVTVTHASGQGHESTYATIVADALGIDRASVHVRQGVNDVTLVGNHTGGSRSTAAAGSVCLLAAGQLVERARPLAAQALDVEPSQVTYAAGRFTERESRRSVSLADLAAGHTGDTPALRLVAEATIGSTFPNTCHIAEVEVDPDTGRTIIARYTVVDDCGTVISPAIVEGQVHGAVAQGAGQVFGEQIVFDAATGQMLTGSLMDYALPRADWLRHLDHDECPIPSKLNPLGAKGVGEGGCVGALPALVNAVLHALRPAGVPAIDMPLTPARVWSALQATSPGSPPRGDRPGSTG